MMPTIHTLPTYCRCAVCGNPQANPHTLHVRWLTDGETVWTEWAAQDAQMGYRGLVHGGILCSLLDEGVGWAAALGVRKMLVTGELNVRFLRPLPIGQAVTIRGYFGEDLRRYVTARGEVVDAAGTRYATAIGKFFPVPAERVAEIASYLTVEEGDLTWW